MPCAFWTPLGQGVELEVHSGADFPLPEQGLEVERPLLAAHQHHRGGAGALQLGEVGRRRVQAGPEGPYAVLTEGAGEPRRKGKRLKHAADRRKVDSFTEGAKG